MTRLRLALSERPGTNATSTYLPLLTDETVLSWSRRQRGVRLVSDSQSESAFGQLSIDLPELPRALHRALCRAAEPPDEWLLQPRQRTLTCPRCVAEDWVNGVPHYDRRDWCVAWRTCCPRHGPLFDTDNCRAAPVWHQLIDSPLWTGQELQIVNRRPNVVQLTLSLGTDRRGVHLEAALAGGRRNAWFPRGMTKTTLRAAYCVIVMHLLDQFHLENDGPVDQWTIPGFSRALNGNRFAINVLAEAILSVCTDTPLPACALAMRTSLLVRAIGWGDESPPIAHIGQVLFRGPTRSARRLVRDGNELRIENYAGLDGRTKFARVGYLTLPETRLLGLSFDEAVTWLRRMTRNGQFLAFDARRGRVIENKFLPEQARLPSNEVPDGLILPAWSFRPPSLPRTHALDDVVRFWFSSQPPDVVARSAARRRRWLRENRRSVQFSPSVRRGEAAPVPPSDESLATDSDRSPRQ